MTTLQQGWIFCADGFGWLQRLTIEGIADRGGLAVDISEFTTGEAPDGWRQYLAENGWYVNVPSSVVNELAEKHGGIVDAMSSRLDIQGPVNE